MCLAVAEAVTETAKDFLDSTICETCSPFSSAHACGRLRVLTLTQHCDDILDCSILSMSLLAKKVFICFCTNIFIYFTADGIQELCKTPDR